MKKKHLLVSEETHRRVKILAVDEDLTIDLMVMKMLAAYVGKPELFARHVVEQKKAPAG